MCDETYTNGKPTVRVVVCVCAVRGLWKRLVRRQELQQQYAAKDGQEVRRKKKQKKKKKNSTALKRIGEILSGSESANMHRAHPIHIVLLLIVFSLSIHPQTRKIELFLLFIRVIFAIFSIFLFRRVRLVCGRPRRCRQGSA